MTTPKAIVALVVRLAHRFPRTARPLELVLLRPEDVDADLARAA